MQATTTQEAKPVRANSATSHDPILTPEDEAFMRQVMSQTEDGDPGATTTTATEGGGGNAVVADSSPTAQDTQHVEEFGKKLGEQQRRATTEMSEEDGSKDKKKDSEKGKGEGETAPAAEKKKKRWSLNWPWKKEGKEKVRLIYTELFT